ncbi:hypothetical protein WA1_18665 [Scytonema hofmannii PCC 7110]|uniref:HTH cro/C1-type domain-containing protein n=1 Tax=Scytonema hofmannii PCC 7110 TaxID=128403 RepID=A0A139XBE9_9CYAN|nr:helix-turn-helix transcriptional regulator [Scytonema hofmannii]KYC42027.1 hypothetical protein WA1_18665 [Scytonema hofmannii PCC 7110]
MAKKKPIWSDKNQNGDDFINKKYKKTLKLIVESSDLYELLGESIRIARVARGLSQEDLARKLECDRSVIRLLEKQGGDPVVLRKLIKILNLEDSYFNFDDGEDA